METYCVSFEKNTANENKNRLMLLSNCTVGGKKKSNFSKNQELH